METNIINRSLRARLAGLMGYEPKPSPVYQLRRSAVLIPILDREPLELVYTLRSQHLKHHPGQISFPGGRIETGESGWEAALREAREEIGLAPERVRYAGQIEDFYSPRGFHIQCYVGLVDSFEPDLNRDEVEALVQVPLKDIFDRELHELKPWEQRPERMVHYFHFDRGLVWGVTGEITHNLRLILERL